MARSTKPRAAKDPLARVLAELERGRVPFDPPPPAPTEGDDEIILAGWRNCAPAFEAGLADADDEGRALYQRAKAYVEAGMPGGAVRDLDEQAAFFVASQGSATPAEYTHRWIAFTRRWIAAGGLAYAFALGVHADSIRSRVIKGFLPWHMVLLRYARDVGGANQGSLSRVLMFLAPEVARLDPAARSELRATLAPTVARLPATVLAYVAVALDDGEWAREAVRRAEAEGLSFRDPWPVQLIECLRDGETLAHLLAIGGAALQFHGPGYLYRARARFSDDVIADVLVRFFAAALAEPRRMWDTYVKRFAVIACTVAHPHVAWLFAEHGTHKWLKAYAPIYAARHPDVTPARPSDRALAERLMPREYVRPAGYSKAELAALDPAARTARLLEALKSGHLGAELVLMCLPDHPSPEVALALHARITDPNFATQMPKPGFHKELQADLSAFAKQHPDIAAAIAAAKKTRRSRS